MFRSIVECITKVFSYPSGKDTSLSDKSFYHSTAYGYRRSPVVVNHTVNPEMVINISTPGGIGSLFTNVSLRKPERKPKQEEYSIADIELFGSSLVGDISTDGGYHSMLDCSTGGSQRVEIEKLTTKHLRAVKDLEEKLKESNSKNLTYCRDIEVLEKCSKLEREEIKALKTQLMTFKNLEEQLEESRKINMKYRCEIETLRSYNSARKNEIVKLQAVVQGQGIKLEQMEKESEMYSVEEDSSTVMMKQNKISDLEKCKMKLRELEIKHKEMLEVKKECEVIVEQRKATVAELREDCERKIHELKQWKAFCALRQHDEAKIEESYQKVMGKALEDMTKIQVEHKMGIGKPTIVQIKLIGAKNLLICGRDGTSDPYCTIGIIKEENKGTLMKAAASMKEFYMTKEHLNQLNCQDSSVAYNTTNPTWNEKFELFVTNFESCVLAFEVWDDSENDAVKLRDMKLVMRDMNLSDDKSAVCIGGEGDDYMGRAFLTASMIKSEPIEWALPLYSRNKKRKYGELRVRVNSVTF